MIRTQIQLTEEPARALKEIAHRMIFVDTSALYALMDADDRNHAAASVTWAERLDQPVQFLTSNHVLVDCTNIELTRRLGQRTLFAFDRHYPDHGLTQAP